MIFKNNNSRRIYLLYLELRGSIYLKDKLEVKFDSKTMIKFMNNKLLKSFKNYHIFYPN